MEESSGGNGETLPLDKIDFILVHQIDDEGGPEKKEKKKNAREKFLLQLQKDFQMDTEKVGESAYIKLRCSFQRLCQEAENVKLEMPLEKGKLQEKKKTFPLSIWFESVFVTDNEADYISAPFTVAFLHLFKGHENKETFFRRSLRSFLTYNILINLNVDLEDIEDDESAFRTCQKTVCSCCISNTKTEITPKTKRDRNTRGLKYFRLKNIFDEDFILHENHYMFESNSELQDVSCKENECQSDTKDLKHGDEVKENSKEPPREIEQAKHENGGKDIPKMDTKDNMPNSLVDDENDLVKEMNNTWMKFFKFQPLWKIRNYFGEKIAFYFAWAGELITSLWIPSIIGIAVFIFGLVSRFNTSITTTSGQDVSKLAALLNVIRFAFDNAATPYFSMIICLWGTIFLEFWKRRSARLSYEWDVNDFQATEPDRPEFTGTKEQIDPVTSTKTWYYPLKRQMVKYTASISAVVFMICLVVISLVGVVVYRVIVNVSQCPDINGVECLLLTTIVSSLLNAVSIVILGFVYKRLAAYLTDWENHQKQSKYDDALAVKIFAFQFVNSYASCFYIAFFIERIDLSGMIGKGDNFKDSCQGTCMSQLSFQVMALMFIKPFPKFFLDIILPVGRYIWRRLPCRQSRVTPNTHYLKKQKLKPQLNDFTLGEYTEKVIQYGFLMLFAASFPLAPLLALITNFIDLRVDAYRLLNFYRRPISFIAQDIGVWYGILTFVNFVGVISNAFLVAFTSDWGQNYDLAGKLIIVLAFEHIVFFLKYVLAYLIPDVPVDVQQAINRERFQTRELFMKLKENNKKKEN